MEATGFSQPFPEVPINGKVLVVFPPKDFVSSSITPSISYFSALD
jgi:hypothetical protein